MFLWFLILQDRTMKHFGKSADGKLVNDILKSWPTP